MSNVNVVDYNSENMSMNQLMEMSQALDGLANIKIHEEGRYVMVFPTQILKGGKRRDITSTKGYQGLPELVIAEDFANMKPTLDGNYVNYEMPEPKFQGIFDYDLNKHLYENLHDFRKKLQDQEWFNAQTDEVKEKLHNSEFFTLENEVYTLKPAVMLLNDDWTIGEYVNFVGKYQKEIVFYANPVTSYKLDADEYPKNVAIYYKVKTQEEADMLGVEVGDQIESPLRPFSKQYNSMFHTLYVEPLREKHPNVDSKDFYQLPEVKRVMDQKLMGNVQFQTSVLVNRIKASETKNIEVKEGESIPTRMGRLDLSANNLSKWFNKPQADPSFSPISFATFDAEVPKRDGNKGHDYAKQYSAMNFTSPGITERHLVENKLRDDQNPFTHKVDQDFRRRMKVECLNFPFQEAHVTEGSFKFGEELPLSAIMEIIRTIGLPMLEELDPNNDEHKSTINSAKNFFRTKIGMEEEEIDKHIKESGVVASDKDVLPAQGENIEQPQPQVQEPVPTPTPAPAPAPSPTPPAPTPQAPIPQQPTEG